MFGRMGMMGAGFGRLGVIGPTSSAPAETYVGPGDLFPGYAAYWGGRAYSAATIGLPAVTVIRASDSTTQAIATVAGGGLDATAYNAFTNGTTGKIVTLHDLTGNGYDITNATDASRHVLTFAAAGLTAGRPCFQCNTAGGIYTRATAPVISGGATVVAFSKRTGNFSGQGRIVGLPGFGMTYFESPDTVQLFGTLDYMTAPATDDVWHSLVGACVQSGGPSHVYVDGVNNQNFSPTGGDSASGDIHHGNRQFIDTPLVANLVEFGVHPTLLSQGDAVIISDEQFGYWTP